MCSLNSIPVSFGRFCPWKTPEKSGQWFILHWYRFWTISFGLDSLLSFWLHVSEKARKRLQKTFANVCHLRISHILQSRYDSCVRIPVNEEWRFTEFWHWWIWWMANVFLVSSGRRVITTEGGDKRPSVSSLRSAETGAEIQPWEWWPHGKPSGLPGENMKPQHNQLSKCQNNTLIGI